MVTILPATIMTLECFLETHGLELLVQERGDGLWEARLHPEVLYSTDDSASFSSNNAVRTHSRVTSEQAIECVCQLLSAHQLCVNHRAVDNRFTRIVVEEALELSRADGPA
jgi:hypothetical protein